MKMGTRVAFSEEFEKSIGLPLICCEKNEGTIIQLNNEAAVVFVEKTAQSDEIYKVPIHFLKPLPDFKIGDRVRTYHQVFQANYFQKLYSKNKKKDFNYLLSILTKPPKKCYHGEIVGINEEVQKIIVLTKKGERIEASPYWFTGLVNEFIPVNEEETFKDSLKPIEVEFPHGKDKIYIQFYSRNMFYISYPLPYLPEPIPDGFKLEIDTYVDINKMKFIGENSKGTRKYKKQIFEAVEKAKKKFGII